MVFFIIPSLHIPLLNSPPALPVQLRKCPALVKIGLTPDPWPVCAAHRRFYVMDPTEVPPLPDPV